MQVLCWFLEEYPIVWMPACLFLMVVVLACGVLSLALFPVLDFIFDKKEGVDEC